MDTNSWEDERLKVGKVRRCVERQKAGKNSFDHRVYIREDESRKWRDKGEVGKMRKPKFLQC